MTSLLYPLTIVATFLSFQSEACNSLWGNKNPDRNSRDCRVSPPTGEYWNDTVVNYYVNLVNTETEKALHYVLPTNNDYFLEGSTGDSNTTIDLGDYDFILVGAGSAGGTVAYSLSENKNWKVLLVEAGGNETNFSDIPHFLLYLEGSRMNWGYYTTPQQHACRGMVGNRCNYPRGQVKGGTGVINALMYVRGNKNDYNTWAKQGNPGWAYKDVLPYFIKQEHSQIIGDPGYHGENGLLNVAYPIPHNPLLPTFLEANEAVGRPLLDYNGANQLGASRTQFTIINGRRESSDHVYLTRAMCRKNLHIVDHALVTKILINDQKRAYCIEFIRFGRKYKANATKEVVVSGGSINTPQLLLVSGIGPKEELEKVGVKSVHDLPGVGKNLQDHQTFFGLAFSTNFTLPSISEENLTRMYLKGYGPYTSPGNAEGVAFFRVKNSTLPPGVPDIQLIFVPPNCTSSFTTRQYNADAETTALYWSQIDTQKTFQIYMMLLHPKSTGTVTLTSPSPLEFPAIDVNWLTEEVDRQTMYEGIKAVMRLVDSEPFRKINATYVPTNVPECDRHKFPSRDYWICNLEYFTATMYHPTSTCAMGNGPDAVVDSKLRVHGIKNLRIVDDSVMPEITSGNTNAPAFMIGAKAGDIIKEDYK